MSGLPLSARLAWWGTAWLQGRVDPDAFLDAMLDEAGTGVLNQGAVAGAVAGAQPDFMTPLWNVVRSRITWLVESDAVEERAERGREERVDARWRKNARAAAAWSA